MIDAEAFLAHHPPAARHDGIPDGDAVHTDATAADAVAVTPTGTLGASADASPTRPRSRARMMGHVRRVDEARTGDADACREAALRLLDAAPRSSQGLRGRLLDKGFDEAVASGVVSRLTALGLIDDAEYARSVVRSCLSRRLGERATLTQMRLKDVAEPDARRALDEARGEGAFERAAWELGERVEARTRGMDRQIRLRRLWGAGARKGHDAETIRRVAAELFG